MKKIFNIIFIAIVGLLYCYDAQAQEIRVGVRGGVGGGNAEFSPRVEKGSTFGVPQGGVFLQYRGKGKYVDGLQTELNYVVSSFQQLAKSKSDSSYTRSINSVELPIMWHAHLGLDQNRFNVFLNLGPYVSYDISSKESWIGNEIAGSKWENREHKYQYDPIVDNRLGFGVIGGVGISYLIAGRVCISVEGRYRFGLSNLYKNPVNFGNSEVYQSQVSQYSVSMGLSYRFGKKIKYRKKNNEDKI